MAVTTTNQPSSTNSSWNPDEQVYDSEMVRQNQLSEQTFHMLDPQSEQVPQLNPRLFLPLNSNSSSSNHLLSNPQRLDPEMAQLQQQPMVTEIPRVLHPSESSFVGQVSPLPKQVSPSRGDPVPQLLSGLPAFDLTGGRGAGLKSSHTVGSHPEN